ncbi:hypothetical protein SRA_00583 [Streptococcus ratti FA-1 = DSM 20564]|uniref:Uncharacterized protein n=1 Tax=Streptococcus ratti FA-1 = DSM 20564 TaxID=699248 RepID=A0ABP2R3W4_STRRT|nr:hypothetical protein SRA_00583 [Streptococcus ratti FA-1 = DSM 20564]QEY07147.1 hypothetical protein FY406_05565 [Streptococcus ratti]
MGSTQKLKILVRLPTPAQLARFSALALWQKESQPTTASRAYSKIGILDEFLRPASFVIK